MKAAAELLARLPGPVTTRWPQGELFVQGHRFESLSADLATRVESWGPRGSEQGGEQGGN